MKTSIAFILGFILLGTNGYCQTTNYKAYAVFLLSFSKYIEWPAAENPTEDFIIAVYGSPKLLIELETSVSGRKVGQRTIRIVDIKKTDEISKPQILFIGEGKSGALEEILTKVKGKQCLIVTERENMIRKGAGISFLVTAESLLKFQLNEITLNENNLKASSYLKNLAYKGS